MGMKTGTHECGADTTRVNNRGHIILWKGSFSEQKGV